MQGSHYNYFHETYLIFNGRSDGRGRVFSVQLLFRRHPNRASELEPARRVVSSILIWSSEFFLSRLVLEIPFFQNKKKRCFQLPKPYTSYVHLAHSLKQHSSRTTNASQVFRKFRWIYGHDSGRVSLFLSSAPLHASRISAHALTTLLTLKEKTKDCLQSYVD